MIQKQVAAVLEIILARTPTTTTSSSPVNPPLDNPLAGLAPPAMKVRTNSFPSLSHYQLSHQQSWTELDAVSL